jgi:hypothetical protein
MYNKEEHEEIEDATTPHRIYDFPLNSFTMLINKRSKEEKRQNKQTIEHRIRFIDILFVSPGNRQFNDARKAGPIVDSPKK